MGDSSSRPKENSVQDFLKKDLTIGIEDKKLQKQSFFVNHFKQKHAQALAEVVKKDPQVAWREIDHNREQEKILTDMDVAYEKGSAIFFEDDRPLYPTPVKTEQENQPKDQPKESDTTIFFKANLVSSQSHNKPALSPIQVRTQPRARQAKKYGSMDSVVPSSVHPYARTSAYNSTQQHIYRHKKKKSHTKAYGLALLLIGVVLLAGSVFMSLQGAGAMSYSAQVYRATNNNNN
jgi:hypothetical protein